MKGRAAIAMGLLSVIVACGGEPPPRAPAPQAPVPVTPPALPPSSPLASEPAPVVEGATTVASFHGMPIVVRRRPGAEFTAAELVIKGGVRNWTKEHAGVEGLALTVAAHGGTKSLPKLPFTRKLARLGASIEPLSGLEASSLRAKAPTGEWEETFALLADVFLAPAMPSSEIALAKAQRLSEIRHEMEDGDGRLGRLTRATLYAGHPYEASISTVESVGGLSDADVAAHEAKLREMSRLLLVIVGDVDANEVVNQVARAFADVPVGAYAESKTPPLHYGAGKLAGDAFKLPTNYVESAFAAPVWTDPDYVPMRLVMRALAERVWEEVRTKRNLSYAPGASSEVGSAAPFAALYVTAVDPETTMKVMLGEAKRIQDTPLTDKELAALRAVFATEYATHTERVDGLAWGLANAQLYAGDWRFADKLLDRVKATTPAEIQAAAKKWMTNYQTAIVGDPKKLDPATVLAK